MENNITKNNNETVERNQLSELNIKYILTKIDKKISDTDHIDGALNSLISMGQSEAHDIAGQSKADAIVR